MKYGELTVLDEFRDKRNFIYYKCKCSCGNIVNVYRGNLISGKTKSCGCYKKKKLKELYSKKNKFYFKNNIAVGITNNTKNEFYIDKEDYERVKEICWYETSNGYIAHKDKNTKILMLHRFITNCEKGKIVDHINHNRKDNRKCNLRICNYRDNSLNRKNKPNGISKIKRGENTYYIVQLLGKYIGCYKNYDDAVKVRNDIIRRSYL